MTYGSFHVSFRPHYPDWGGKAGGVFHIYFIISDVNGKKEGSAFHDEPASQGEGTGAFNAKSGSLSGRNRFYDFRYRPCRCYIFGARAL
ncbi:hypothetical protein [Geobacillus sp. YHL]|uniref:hypothetical protein n=1 Tax=Geobacillus sp. YHL TaxID=2796117 RepID=UPI001EF1251E|nr:hypothetical protein [Geobacillus sp. YHL]MCG6794040.1 hypothetical protein [Geobacillus sp. YHL]